jgi:hypothetical protein
MAQRILVVEVSRFMSTNPTALAGAVRVATVLTVAPAAEPEAVTFTGAREEPPPPPPLPEVDTTPSASMAALFPETGSVR